MFEVVKNKSFKFIYYITKNSRKNPYIYSIEDTVNKILNDKVSVSRYGDGELKWMSGLKQDSFQSNSSELRKRLSEVIKSDRENHIVCLSDVFGDLSQYTEEAQSWWKIFMGKFRFLWIKYLKEGKKYYNTNISRPYMDYKDKRNVTEKFHLIKQIWEKRNILIVEGEMSRLGVGNDLFDNSLSINRIICPSTDAFAEYSEILKSVSKNTNKGDLILIALGPTATILAYDLSILGYQAIDIGHIDIEYEWFLNGYNEKLPIEGKYVNEAKKEGGTVVKLYSEKNYINSIVDIVKQFGGK